MKNLVHMISGHSPNLYRGLLFFLAWAFSLSSLRKVSGRGNQLISRGAFLKNCRFDIRGNGNRVEIAPECILKNVRFFVRGSGHTIKIGAQVRISRSALLWCEDENGTLIIGEGTRIEEAHIAVTEPGSKIEVGARCLFAYDIEIRCGDSHSILDAQTGKRINPPANVKIGDRVWIGMGAKILKGVELGNDSIVATGAVVAKSVPAGSIVAGNPAKVVRDGVRWEYQRLQDRY